MIYEIRTYRLKPRSLPEVEKRFGEAYEYRKKYSELAGFFHAEIGQLNEIVHIWRYKDLEERARVREALAKEPNWPAKIQEFIIRAESEIIRPFPFAPEWQPGEYGPIYELREYNFRPELLPDLMKGWEEKLPERLKRSPLLLAGTLEFGNVNKFVHLWAYKSMDERLAVRTKAVEDGIWPPSSRDDLYFEQRNRILMPSSFSPSR